MSALPPYTRQLLALQPPGQALPRQPNTNWVKLLEALADELTRADGRVRQLIEEITVSDTAIEMLDGWESALGLPDPCAPPPTDPVIRRARIRAKLASIGGQSAAYFLDVTLQLGFLSTIKTYDAFEMGLSSMGDPVGGYEWNSVWQLDIPGNVPTNIRQLVECVIYQIAPAHTRVLFGFNGEPPEATIYYNGQFAYDGMTIYGGY